MTNIAISKEPYVIELIVYKVKSKLKDDFHDLLEDARKHIKSLPGMVEYNTFKSTSNDLIFIDLVKWETLAQAVDAAKKVEHMKTLSPFMNAFEEIKFMDHFEQFTLFNQNEKITSSQDSDYYNAYESPILVDIEQQNYLMINGVSAPDDPQFLKSIEAIYAVAYQVKAYYKAENNDFSVAEMEAQWWVEGGGTLEKTSKENWSWNIMIPMPHFVDSKTVDQCIQGCIKQQSIPFLSEVALKAYKEGMCVQVLHIGSYFEEEASIQKILDFASAHNLEINGHHHEIYISDPMKVPEDKLETIIRYPVK